MIARGSSRLTLPLLLLLALAVALPSCRGTKKDKAPAEQNRMPAFFEEIPADTIFFVGAREPVPESIAESIVEGAESWRKIADELDADTVEALDIDEEPEEELTAKEQFLLDELGGEVTLESLQSIGIDTTPRFALYGLGTVPVFRMELSDGEALRGVLERYRKEFDRGWADKEVAGVRYWEHEVPPSALDDESAEIADWEDKPDLERDSGQADPEPEPTRFVLFRVADDEIVFTFVNDQTREQALPYFLGIKKPAESLATSERITEIASRHNLQKWFVAFFDIETTAKILEDPTIEPTTITERVLQAEDPWSDYSEACRRDTARLLGPMTVMYGGLREFSDNVTDVVFGLELQEDAARRLSELRAGTPGFSTRVGQDAIFMTGWGVRTGALVDLIADVGKSFQSEPFECEDYEELNKNSQTLAMAKGSMPAWASAIDGFSMMLNSVGFEIREGEDGEGSKPVIKPRALAILDTSKPEALMYFVQTFAPEIKKLNLQPDGVPVQIPGATDAYPGLIEPVVFMTRDGIGATVGKDIKDVAVELLSDDEPVTSPVYVMRANLGEAARVTLEELDVVIDKAAENREERNLSEKDIAQSKKLVEDLQELVAEREFAIGVTVEIDEYGALMSYRGEGAGWRDVDWEEQFSGFDERFESLEKVLGTYEEPPGPPEDLGNTRGTINGSQNSPGPAPPSGEQDDANKSLGTMEAGSVDEEKEEAEDDESSEASE